jgi:hypothetical protein
MPASTRGSSWATSATTNRQPSSATAAGRTWSGTESAPPPVDAHRPVTTPPGRNQGRKRPSRTQASSQFQPLAVMSRESFLYSSSAGMPGWSSCSRVQDRVSSTGSPAVCSARSSSPGESGFSAGAAKASRMATSSRSRPTGRAPVTGRGPSRSASSASWTSARQGSPACVISAAASAPDDSAASSRASRPRSPEAARVRCCRSCSATGSSRSAGSARGNSAASLVVTGASALQASVRSPASRRWSANGVRRRRA